MRNNLISQQGKRHTDFDVVVIGSGIAALSYILELWENNPTINIALITKKQLQDSNSNYAQGGVAAADLRFDTIEAHLHDTIKAGAGLCNLTEAKEILAEGADTIAFLLRHDVILDRTQDNELSRTQEAGHSVRRIYHHGDQTGKIIIHALIQKIIAIPTIHIFENHTAINLITQQESHKPQAANEVVGVYVLDEQQDLIHTFLTKTIVLATGGAGKVYRYTTNPETATGDGIAMAYRAQARIGGMEFYQFHPTLLYHSKINNFLLSETLRGEGAYLLRVEDGERFMHRYSPQHMELATRDVVARAIFNEIEASQYDYVLLDIRHREKSFLQKRFPVIYQTLLESGLDLSRDLIPVVPAAHYLCGGILADHCGKTDLKRLYAIGETAFTGLHGANRLASNSLLEGIVMGRHAARASLIDMHTPVVLLRPIKDWDSASVVDKRRASQINIHWRGLRGEMSSFAGIIRTEAGLRDQLKLILARRSIIEEYYWKYTISRDLIELRNIVLIAELIVRSALLRRESRGAHYREDFPETSETMQQSTLKLHDSYPMEIL